MKILLVVKSKFMENLGVMYLSAIAKKNGHACKIIGIHEAYVAVLSIHPDVIGYSIMTGDQSSFKIENQRILGSWPVRLKKPQIIVGGPHPTFFPADCGWADHIVAGEAEDFMEELCGSDTRHPSIGSIPWPDRADFPDMRIRDFITSRGCPYKCAYCYNNVWMEMFPNSSKVRTREVGDVINEIDHASPDFVYFQDSCFGVSMKWMREFSPVYRSRIMTPYHCHLRPNQVTDEMGSLLFMSGCRSVRIALETASKRLRELINRANTTNEDTLNASKVLKKWGIKLMIQNILGLPTSTIEDDLHTLEVNIMCSPSYGWCSIFQPYPGTTIGDLCKMEGWYTGDYSEISDSFFDNSVLNFDETHKEQLVCLQRAFALCVMAEYVPDPSELTIKNFPKLIHKIMRKVGDNVLYGGVI